MMGSGFGEAVGRVMFQGLLLAAIILVVVVLAVERLAMWGAGASGPWLAMKVYVTSGGASDVRRGHDLRRRYRLTAGQVRQMEALQEGRCASCGRLPAEGHRLHVDHEHATGRVRGLLCGGCNKALGFLGEDGERIVALGRYLARWARAEVRE